MDFTNIFDEYAAQKRAKEQAATATKSDEKKRRELNAQRMDAHLRSVVYPLVQTAKDQIEGFGLNAQIEAVSGAEVCIGGNRFSLGVQIVHRNTAGPSTSIARIIYSGSDDTMAIRMEMIGSGSLATLSENASLTVDQCTAERVHADLSKFIRAILPKL